MAVTATAGIERALLGVYQRAAPVFVAGHGCRLVDEEGREYLDFGSGIAVNALGYGDGALVDMARAALDSGLIHVSNLYRTLPGEELAAELVARSFADRVFFCNSGAESNEAAIKFARRWGRAVGGAEKHEIIALKGSFHGRLMGSLALTDRPAYREPFLPLMPGARIVAADVAAVEAVASAERTAAIMVEPVQGEGGVVPLPAAVLRGLRGLADRVGALLVFDEVQCGLGRTGSLFACESSGVTPDIMTLAKPLAGGLPMGAVLLTDRVADTIQPGDHATTFGGGPFVASVALHVVRRVADPAFLAKVRDDGEFVRNTVGNWVGRHGVVAVRGQGLMWGIELDKPAGPFVGRALDAGLLILTAGERVIRLVPPLVIERDELESGLSILRGVLA
jgi:predicted acetylornithine/succinylornithine family transaminase